MEWKASGGIMSEYCVTMEDSVDFSNRVFRVNNRPFHVTSIDCEENFEPIIGVCKKRVLTDFRGLTNEWDQDLIRGQFYSESLEKIENSVLCIQDETQAWEGSIDQALKFVVDALRSILNKLAEHERQQILATGIQQKQPMDQKGNA